MRLFRTHHVITALALLIGTLTFSCVKADDTLHKAAYYGDVEQVSQLIQQKNLNLDERDSSGGTPLHAAMFQKNTAIVQLLIDRAFDINAIGPKNGYTPLHDAVWANNPETAKLLLKNGAKTDIQGKDGLTPYQKAVKENKPELIKILKR